MKWIVNLIKSLILLPSIIIGSILLGLWLLFRFPFWWAWRYKRAQRFRERAKRIDALNEMKRKGDANSSIEIPKNF